MLFGGWNFAWALYFDRAALAYKLCIILLKDDNLLCSYV